MVERRKIILRILLASLAVAAAAGVLAVLITDDEIFIRVMASGFTAAGAATLILPLSFLVDRPATRPAGLFGITIVVVEFVLGLGFIWLVVDGVWVRYDEEVGVTLTSIGLLSLVTLIALLLVRTKSMRIAGYAGVGVGAAGLLLFLVATWESHLPIPTYGYRWWETAWAFLGFGLLAAACLLGMGPRDRRWWRWIGVAASVAEAALLIADIWQVSITDETHCIVMGIAFVATHANLIFLLPLRPGQLWLRWCTFGAAAATSLLLDVYAVGHLQRSGHDIVLRGAGAAVIVASCGTLALLVLGVLNRRVTATRQLTSISEMTIICPQCRKKQQVGIGRTACRSCGLRFRIDIEEPSCPKCGYLLIGLTSGRCPECGTLIAEGDG